MYALAAVAVWRVLLEIWRKIAPTQAAYLVAAMLLLCALPYQGKTGESSFAITRQEQLQARLLNHKRELMNPRNQCVPNCSRAETLTRGTRFGPGRAN